MRGAVAYSLSLTIMQRDRNGYIVVTRGRRKFSVTPYNDSYSIRWFSSGALAQDEETRKLLFFASEEAAVRYLDNPANEIVGAV
jgi:hypothetical protein